MTVNWSPESVNKLTSNAHNVNDASLYIQVWIKSMFNKLREKKIPSEKLLHMVWWVFIKCRLSWAWYRLKTRREKQETTNEPQSNRRARKQRERKSNNIQTMQRWRLEKESLRRNRISRHNRDQYVCGPKIVAGGRFLAACLHSASEKIAAHDE